MTHLVIGHRGQVGSALMTVLASRYDVEGIDQDDDIDDGLFDVIHVCLPWSEQFTSIVAEDIGDYLRGGGLVIIHSTVPVGTSAALGAVHSPIRGVHPELVRHIKEFPKFVGGSRAEEAAELFEACGIKTIVTERSDTTEALKLWDTLYLGWNLLYQKEMKRWCDAHDIDFAIAYTQANQTYNDSYSMLGMTHVVRPVLKWMPGPCGGHCVCANAELLDSELATIFLMFNDRWGNDAKED